MQQRKKKAEKYRSSIVKSEKEEMMKKIREKVAMLEAQEDNFKENHTYGECLLADILEKSFGRDQARQLQQKYTRQSLSYFLESMYDSTDFQLAAIKILKNYFHVGYSQGPPEEIIDKLLGLLTRLTNPQVLNDILFIFSDVLMDHFKYCIFLIEKKNFISTLLGLLEKFTNSNSIVKSILSVIHSLTFSSQWHQELRRLIEPLFRIVSLTPIKAASTYIEAIFDITKLKPDVVAPEVYKRGILDICNNIRKEFHNRAMVYYYFKFAIFLKSYLNEEDVRKLLSVVENFVENQRKYESNVGGNSGRISMTSIKELQYNIVNELLSSQKQDFSSITYQLIKRSHLDQLLARELLANGEENLTKILVEINLYFYAKSEGKERAEYRTILEEAAQSSSKVNHYLQNQLQDIEQYHKIESGGMDIEELNAL